MCACGVLFCFVLFYLYYSFYLSDSVVLFICIAFFGYYRVHIQHRYDAKDPKYRILYNHLNQPGHDRCSTMKVRIIEKIYHHTNSCILSTPYRTDRELFWFKELGTAMYYGCNDNIKGAGNLLSPGCSEINVISLFNSIPRTERNHKRILHPNVRKSSKPRPLQDTFNDLLSNIQKPLGIHHNRTILFSLPVNYLKDLRDFGLDKGGVVPFSPKYRLSSIM